MKKTAFLLLISCFIFSCSPPAEKKVVIGKYDSTEIKKNSAIYDSLKNLKLSPPCDKNLPWSKQLFDFQEYLIVDSVCHTTHDLLQKKINADTFELEGTPYWSYLKIGNLFSDTAKYAVMFNRKHRDIYGLEIYRREAGKWVMKFENYGVDINPFDFGYVYYEDCNFDGYKDIYTLSYYGIGGGRAHYHLWLYDKEEGRFYAANEFIDLACPTFDYENKLVISNLNTGCGGLNRRVGIYFWEDDWLLLKKEIIIDGCSDSRGVLIREYRKEKDEMILYKQKTQKLTNDILEKYVFGG